jgi:ABC-2 type transport system ATP-binding protein
VAILDEPTAGMDVEARAATREVLAGLRASGVAVLLTSHDLADVERMADRLAILDRGRIVGTGTPQDLIAGSAPVLRFRLSAVLSEADRAALAARLAELGPGAVSIEPDGAPGRYRVEGPPPTPALVVALGEWCASVGVLIIELRTGGGTLEERYLELTGAGGDDDEADEPAPPATGRRGRRR